MQDPVRQWTELEFRDGDRMVPDYLVDMMRVGQGIGVCYPYKVKTQFKCPVLYRFGQIHNR